MLCTPVDDLLHEAGPRVLAQAEGNAQQQHMQAQHLAPHHICLAVVILCRYVACTGIACESHGFMTVDSLDTSIHE